MFDSVLVVDDDPAFCEIVRTYLEQAGTGSITVVHDGQRALNELKLAENEIDFIVLDLNMPVFDGIEFLGVLGEQSFAGKIAIVSSETPVIIDMAETLGSLHGLNIVDAVKKPLAKQDLDRWFAAQNV